MEKLFVLQKCGEEAGGVLGGTAPYEVIFTRPCTVKEFVEYILSTEREWGYIGIENKEVNPFFGFPNIEYSYGKFTNNTSMGNLNEFLDKRVTKAGASGGWSCMDYILCVK